MSSHTSEQRPLPAIFAVLGSVGVFTGVAHAAIVEYQRQLSRDFTWAGPDIVWMAPLAYLIYFTAAAIPLAVGALVFRRVPWERVAAVVACALAALSVELMLVPRLAPYAKILLAAGLAVVLSRAYLAGGRRRARRVGLVAVGMLVAAGTIGGFQRFADRRDERRAVAALPPAPNDAPPSVLLVIFDTMRAASAGLYGYARATTPVIDSLGRAGVVFDWAIAPAPWTLPSHASMFTGRPAGSLSADWRNRLDGTARTVAEVLRDRGYMTAGFTGNLYYTGRESGIARGFVHFEDFRTTISQLLWSPALTHTNLFKALAFQRQPRAWLRSLWDLDLRIERMIPNDRKVGHQITGAMLQWQSTAPKRPFFAYLNYYDVHDPYNPPAPYRTLFNGGAKAIDRYDGGIAYDDRELGTLLLELRARGVLQNTIVIMTSDHGEHFGEHKKQGHGNSVYPEAVRVPLLIHAPGRVPAGVRVPYAISSSRLAATILDLAGVRNDTLLPGRSLATYWRQGDSASSPLVDRAPGSLVLTEMGPDVLNSRDSKVNRLRKAMVGDAWYYIRNGDGVEELYAYRSDTSLATNLARDPVRAGDVARYRAALDSAIATFTPRSGRARRR